MIKSIELKNFQSHKSTKIDLVDGVNTIIGRSDSGKSSIIRALYWVANNRPVGDSFVRHGEKGTEVVVSLSDGTKITRLKVIKGKTKSNTYELLKKGSKTKFSAISQTVPKEILKVLLLDKDISVQGQHDPVFLLQKTSGEISRFFNQLVEGLELIDPTLKKIEQKRKALMTGIISAKKTIQNLILKIKGLPDISGLSEKIVELDKQMKKSKATIAAAEKASSHLAEIHKMKNIRLAKINQQFLDSMQKRTANAILEARNIISKIAAAEQKHEDLAEIIVKKDTLAELELRIDDDEARYKNLLESQERCPLCYAPHPMLPGNGCDDKKE